MTWTQLIVLGILMFGVAWVIGDRIQVLIGELRTLRNVVLQLGQEVAAIRLGRQGD